MITKHITAAERRDALKQADLWVRDMLGEVRHSPCLLDTIGPCARAAFTLYAIEWFPTFSILHWKFPWHVLAGKEDIIRCPDDPWIVLLRFCIEEAERWCRVRLLKPLEGTHAELRGRTDRR